MDCISCGAPLTAEEMRYYGSNCEACETLWAARMEAWMNGAEDAELDAIFSVW